MKIKHIFGYILMLWGSNALSLDMNSYCQTRYGSGAYSALAKNDAYGWVCKVGYDQYSLDMNDICAKQEGSSCGKAFYSNFTDPNSWSCECGGASLASNLDILIPNLVYRQTRNYWADLQYIGKDSNGTHQWKLRGLKVNK